MENTPTKIDNIIREEYERLCNNYEKYHSLLVKHKKEMSPSELELVERKLVEARAKLKSFYLVVIRLQIFDTFPLFGYEREFLKSYAHTKITCDRNVVKNKNLTFQIQVGPEMVECEETMNIYDYTEFYLTHLFSILYNMIDDKIEQKYAMFREQISSSLLFIMEKDQKAKKYAKQ